MRHPKELVLKTEKKPSIGQWKLFIEQEEKAEDNGQDGVNSVLFFLSLFFVVCVDTILNA